LDESHKSGFKFVLVMEFSEYGDIEHEIDLRRLKRDYWRETDVMKHMTELIDAFATL